MINFFLYCVLACITTSLCFAQLENKSDPRIDSLKRLLQKDNDTSRVSTLNELCRLHARNDLKLAFQCAEEALVLAKNNKFKKGEAQSLTALGSLNLMTNDLDEAFEYHVEALKIHEDINDKKGIGVSLSNIGTIYQQKSNFSAAMETLLKALKIREEIKDEQGILTTLNSFGAMYMRQADEKSHDKTIYYKAIEYFEKALVLARKLGKRQNEAILRNNIGSIYEQTNEYEKAIEYYLKAVKIREAINDDFQLTSSFHSLGNVYLKMDSIKIAFDYYKKGLIMGEKTQNRLVLAQCYYGLAKIYEKRKEYEPCLQNAEEGLAISYNVENKRGIIDIKNLLARVYALKGDFAHAYKLKDEAVSLKDSVFNAENSKILTNAHAAADKERANAEKERKEKEQQVKNVRQATSNYLGLGVIVFIAGVAFLLFRGQQREKKYSTEIALEKEQSDKLLRNILPDEVADELKTQGKAKARHYGMASVLFTDFQGFTARTATMTPEQVIEELNACFSEFDRIIDKHNLEKIKTIGDAYMCAGGLPVPNTTNPADIIRAGLEIQAYMRQYKEECIARGEAYFQCRLGINTGEVVAGVVGTKKFAYDIWGDTVNTASRAESGGIVDMVNITEATYLLVKDVFECEYRGEIEAKGKGKIGMYLVLGEKKS